MVIQSDFFHQLYKDCEGLIEIRPLPGKSRFFKIGEYDYIYKFCEIHHLSNLFFGVATRDGVGGKKENIINIPTVWCDFDFKVTSKNILTEKLSNFPYKPSIIILTGGGVHLYWRLVEATGKDEIPIVEDVNRRIANELSGDLNSVDAARILRIPNTINHKYPARVKVLKINQFAYELDDFINILPKPEFTYPNKDIVQNKEAAANILECNFIKWCKDNPSEVPEPLWYGMISNLISIRPGGRTLCHRYSKGHPKYSPNETDKKILHAIDGSQPHTCEYIKSNGFSCKKDCGVRAPAALIFGRDSCGENRIGEPHNAKRKRIRISIKRGKEDGP